jgi:hypothetical protein
MAHRARAGRSRPLTRSSCSLTESCKRSSAVCGTPTSAVTKRSPWTSKMAACLSALTARASSTRTWRLLRALADLRWAEAESSHRSGEAPRRARGPDAQRSRAPLSTGARGRRESASDAARGGADRSAATSSLRRKLALEGARRSYLAGCLSMQRVQIDPRIGHVPVTKLKTRCRGDGIRNARFGAQA